MTPLYWLTIGIALLLFIAPLVCYLCAKMITLGILNAKRRFDPNQEEEKKHESRGSDHSREF